MMKKLWKGLSVTLSLCLSCLFIFSSTACETVEEYIPETYGEWDGTYLYKGNARMTTTGENYAPLVPEVTAFDKTYAVESCIDYVYCGETVYLLLRLGEELTETEEDEGEEKILSNVYLPPFTATALVSYDMKEKTSKLLRYRDLESDLPLMADILGVSDDCLLLDGGMTWYAVDFDGEMIENTEFSVDNGISLFDGYVVERVSNELYYRGYSDVERKKICDVGDCLAYECDLVEKDGKSGFIIRKSYGKSKAEEIWRFSFYDFATEEFYEITEQRPESFHWTKENEYFMTYDREATEITVHSGCFGVREETYLSYTDKNFKMFSFDYSGEKVSVKEEYIFDADKDFLFRYTATDERFYTTTDGCFYMTAKWSERVGLFKREVWKTATYRYDYQTKTLTELELEEYNAEVAKVNQKEKRVYEVTVDGVTYYLEEEEVHRGFMVSIETVYRFVREIDGQTEYLQFWTSSNDWTHAEKTDREFWRNAGETGEFRVLPY